MHPGLQFRHTVFVLQLMPDVVLIWSCLVSRCLPNFWYKYVLHVVPNFWYKYELHVVYMYLLAYVFCVRVCVWYVFTCGCYYMKRSMHFHLYKIMEICTLL